MVRDDDRALNATAARVPGDPLGHVARRRGVDAAREGGGRGKGHGVSGAAQLERADRLQILELGEDLDLASRFELDQGTPHGGILDAFACGADRP